MFWIKLALFTVWMTANAPLRLLLSVVQRLAWRPNLRLDELETRDTSEDKDKALHGLYPAAIAADDDGAKFLGMAYAATHRVDVWGHIRALWRDNRFERRGDVEQHEVAFSGDMLSGMLLALSEANMDAKEIDALKDIFDATILRGRWFAFEHPDTSRGRILPWWAFGHEWIQARAVLKFCAGLYGGVYKPLYWWATILALPSRLCPDYGVWLGDYRKVGWSTAHSTALYAHVLGDAGTLQLLADRHPWNAEIQALAGRAEVAEMYLAALDPEWKMEHGDSSVFYEKKGFEAPLSMRRHKHIWEQAPDKMSPGPRPGWTVDWLFLNWVLKQ